MKKNNIIKHADDYLNSISRRKNYAFIICVLFFKVTYFFPCASNF